MANYAVQADLEEQFGIQTVLNASDHENTGVADASVITKACTDATEEINSYLSERYDIPLATVPGILVRVCGDVALYRMCTNYGGMLTDEIRRRYEDAIKWLTNVAKGVIGLGLDDADSAEVIDVPQTCPEMSAEYRLFTRTKMAGLI